MDQALIKTLQELLEVNAYRVWSVALKGTTEAKVTYQRMSRPKVGELVMEISAIGRRSPKDFSNIGRLTKILDRHGNEVPEAEFAGEYNYHITTLDGREITWSNAIFVTVFETLTDPKGNIETGDRS